MHILGFVARTDTPLQEHSPDGPYLQGLRGAAHFEGHGSSHGGGHAGLHGAGGHAGLHGAGGHTGLHGAGGHTGLHGSAHGGGHTGLHGSGHTGLHGGGHVGWHGSQTGSHGAQQSSPVRLQPVQSSAETPKKSNEAKIPSCFLIL